ncbi:MFS transporter, partial [Anaerotignum sp.]|uniref:MFS transporter n=1 Tax=Anaerotignum sp. TaxID=2039241 RepID=UPI00289DCD6F
DFNSQNYRNIINFLNNNASNSEDVFYIDDTGLNKKDNLWNADIYLGINRFFENRIYFILSMPEEAGAIYPLEVAEKDAINLICQNNTLIYPDYVGYFGSYCLVQVPIVSDNNEVVGAVEVGFNKNSFMKEMRAKQIEIIISTAVVLLLSLLLLKEIFFGIKMFFVKKSSEADQLIDPRSVRTPIFLGQTAYHLSVVCVPLFAMQLYNETFGVSKVIAVAVAYSVTLLFVGISAFISGVLIKKIHLHKLLVIGTILSIVGELIAATSGGLTQFIVGRSMFGSGAGMILNILDTMVAMQPDEERVTQGFTMSSAGTNAGTIVGVALGATVITSLGYRWVYVVSAFILLILLITAILFYNKDNVPDAMNYVEVNSDMSFLHFVGNKRVIGYIFFLTVPYFICMGFIDFFLPLEGKNQGLNEETISYIIIIFGLISIYLGPVLTKKLLSILDSYIVLIISAVVMSTAIIYYGLMQSVFALVFACVAIAFADSFFQSVQNIYFTQLPESIQYGQSSTLALSNVVIGMAQMGQAYLFAFAMFFGIKRSFLIIGISFLVLTAIFLILNFEDKNHNKIQKNTNYMNH